MTQHRPTTNLNNADINVQTHTNQKKNVNLLVEVLQLLLVQEWVLPQRAGGSGPAAGSCYAT